ncbi:MAG: cytochrome c [Betaproteobacteria bacterium]|nr:MAG: cytochrome c [Betaproteobacteria bacterium]
MLRQCAVLLGLLCLCASVWPQVPDKPGPMQSGRHTDFDVNQLFASTCGWCHLKGGREAGKGPKLAGTQLTDSEIIARIRNGKPGQMPAFGSAFNDAQLKAIVGYIRELKP